MVSRLLDRQRTPAVKGRSRDWAPFREKRPPSAPLPPEVPLSRLDGPPLAADNPVSPMTSRFIAAGNQGRRRETAAPFASCLQTLARRGRSRETRAQALHSSRILQRLASAALLLIGLHVVAAAQTVTEFPIPSGFGSKAITTGPDGNLWFAEYTKVGRVTPSGVITLYDTPTFSAFNFGIAAGPDGNLWL